MDAYDDVIDSLEKTLDSYETALANAKDNYENAKEGTDDTLKGYEKALANAKDAYQNALDGTDDTLKNYETALTNAKRQARDAKINLRATASPMRTPRTRQIPNCPTISLPTSMRISARRRSPHPLLAPSRW